MFPACAGMNRKIRKTLIATSYVPRVRGDEPELYRWTMLHG